MSWLLAVELGILAGSFIYHRWIEDHPAGPKPGGGSKLPQVAEGSPIPMLYGRCRVRAPVLAWIGNPLAVDFGEAPAGEGPAYRTYGIDMLYVVGLPFFAGTASLNVVYAADYVLVFHDSSPLFGHPTPGKRNVGTSNLFELYGGPATGGGIFGNIEYFDGRQTQVITDGIDDVDVSRPDGCLTDTQAVLERHPIDNLKPFSLIKPSAIPSYRNMAISCLYQWGIGESPNLTSYGFDVTSLSTGSASDLGRSLPEDADPAAVIYDLITGRFGKLGLPASRVDLPSFQAASLALFNEGHGYSRAIEEFTDASELVNEVLRQIDGMLYEEPTTGKIVLKLVRNDYNVATLDDVNPDNAMPSGAGWYQIQGWSETINQVRFSFTDRANGFTEGSVLAQNTANFISQGNRLRSVDVVYPGCASRDVAQRLASRELATLSRPTVKATLVVNRTFHAHRPGDVVTLTWPKLGIAGMVMRIARVVRGPLNEAGITLDLIRDIFDVSLGAFPSSGNLPS